MKTYEVVVDIPAVSGKARKEVRRLLKANGFKLIVKNSKVWTLKKMITSEMDLHQVNASVKSLIESIPQVEVEISKAIPAEKKYAKVIWMPVMTYFNSSKVNYN